MSRPILATYDGSPLAEKALPYAADLAKASDAEVVLLRVIPVLPLIPQALSEDAQRAELQAAADRLRQRGVKVETRIRHIGHETVASQVIDEARTRNAALIVMSTHGRGGLGRWVYGSVADEVMRQAPMPVMLIPPTADASWRDYKTYRVLVPLDGSQLSEAVIEPTCQLAIMLAAEVSLLQVIEPVVHPSYPEPAVYIPFDPEPLRQEAAEYLERVAGRIRQRGLRVATKVTVGRAAEEIAAAAREQHAAAIVIGSHGRGGIARFALGSVASGVIERVSVPVVVARAAAAAAKATEPHRDVVTSAELAMMPLNREELNIIQRALEHMIFTQSSVTRLVEPAQTLLKRVESVDSALGAFAASASEAPTTKASALVG